MLDSTIKWYNTSALPACTVRLNNADGTFAAGAPIMDRIKITLPGAAGVFYFTLEEPDYSFDKQYGNIVILRGTAAPELTTLYDGLLDVAGTDISVGAWNARGSLFSPYQSTFVVALGTNLQNIDAALSSLIHTQWTSQGQPIGFRGRAGYEVGYGIDVTSGIDYTPNSLLPNTSFYYKGQWHVGLGATGAQKTAWDIIRDLCTKNTIDGTGNPAFLDYYVDGTLTPPILKVFQRGQLTTTGVATVVQQKPATVAAGVANSVSATFNSSLTLGNVIIVVAVGQGGTPAGGTFVAFTCADNGGGGGNVYSLVKKNTDQGNNLGAVIFSAPVTQTGTLTVTVTKSVGTVTNPGWTLEIYEVNGLSSATASASAEQEGGALPITTSTTGALTVSSINANFTSANNVTFTNPIDNFNSAMAIGRGSGTWDKNGGTISFVEELEASWTAAQTPYFATFSKGVDQIMNLSDPVSSIDLRNFILYFVAPETVYPNSGDAWSNYDTTGHLTSQWVNVSSVGSGTFTTDTAQAANSGTAFANKYHDNSLVATYSRADDFAIETNGYAMMNFASPVVFQSFSFWFNRTIQQVGTDSVNILLQDTAGNQTSFTVTDTTTPSLPVPGTGGIVKIPMPSSGTPPGGANQWASVAGTFHFDTSRVTDVQISVVLGHDGVTLQNFWLDQIQFGDKWGFGTPEPVYAYNLHGAASTYFTTNYAAGVTSIVVGSTSGFVVGQNIFLGTFTGNQEIVKITALSGTTMTVTTTANAHSTNDPITGLTHDPNSINAFGPRVFPYTDFFIQNGASDEAEGVALQMMYQRKMKTIVGSIQLDGYNQGISKIVPGARIKIIDPKNTYAPTSSTVDSIIDSWVVEDITYVVDPRNNGFTVTYTISPWFASFLAASPDTNNRNQWQYWNRSLNNRIASIYRNTQGIGTLR